jgi:hypothetical protein
MEKLIIILIAFWLAGASPDGCQQIKNMLVDKIVFTYPAAKKMLLSMEPQRFVSASKPSCTTEHGIKRYIKKSGYVLDLETRKIFKMKVS